MVTSIHTDWLVYIKTPLLITREDINSWFNVEKGAPFKNKQIFSVDACKGSRDVVLKMRVVGFMLEKENIVKRDTTGRRIASLLIPLRILFVYIYNNPLLVSTTPRICTLQDREPFWLIFVLLILCIFRSERGGFVLWFFSPDASWPVAIERDFLFLSAG